jgi:hypothetical protein
LRSAICPRPGVFQDTLTSPEFSEEIARNACAHFISTGQSTLEPEATAPDSPIAKYREARSRLHHLALRVDDINAALAHGRAASA